MKNTCCVPNCDSRRSSVKLHRIPKIEIGLKWVKRVNSDKLKDLSFEEIHKFFVCHRHFEKRFVTKSLRLQQTAYPTLFTYQEIETGIPSQPDDDTENGNVCSEQDYTQSKKRKHEDHTYSKTYQIGDIELAQGCDSIIIASTPEFSTVWVQNQEIEEELQTGCDPIITPSTPDFSTVWVQNQEIDQELQTACDSIIIPSTSEFSKDWVQNQEIEQELQTEELQSSIEIERSLQSTNVVTPKKRLVIRQNKMTPRRYRILKEHKKAKRVKRARFSKKAYFDKMTRGLNPLAKKILWMQISQCKKREKGRRFSHEEKIIALAIMKQSAKSYKFLRKIFILPSEKTINKLTSKIHLVSGE